MVVQCQSCQARFRVADDKVTDRGVRVRCTSCRTIFLVRKDGVAVAPSQASTGETVMGLPPVSLMPPPRQAGPAPGVRLTPSAPPAPRPLATAPAAGNGAPPRAVSDHFGMAELTGEAAAPRQASPPFPGVARPSAPPAPARSTPPPSAPGARPKASLGAELDIELGAPAPPKPSRPPPQQSRPAAAPPPGPPEPRAQIGKLPRRFVDEAPAAVSVPPPPPPVFDEMEIESDEAKKPAPPPEPPPPAPARPDMHDPFAGMDLASEGSDHPPPLRPSDPALARVPSAPPPAEGQAASDAAEHGTAAEAEHADSQPPATAKLGRRHLVSSVLTGLIGAGIALALALGTGALSDGALPRMLGLGGGDLVVITEASGLYDTVSGRPVFFVRGRVENRGKRVAPGPVRVIVVMLGESGTATARAESIAGVDATAEDVYALRSPADADKLLKTLAQKRADLKLPPGGSLPFFALFPDPPADLSGQRVQVRLESP